MNNQLFIAMFVSESTRGYAVDCCALFGPAEIAHLSDSTALLPEKPRVQYDIIITDYPTLAAQPNLLSAILQLQTVAVVFASAHDEPAAFRMCAGAKNLINITDHLSPNDAFNLIATALEGFAAAKPT